MNKVSAILIMSLGASLAVRPTMAGPAILHAATSAPAMHPRAHPTATARLSNHPHGRHHGNFFPGTGGLFWDGTPEDVIVPSTSGPISDDINTTFKYDVPWDWAHRYPPGFFGTPPAAPAPSLSYRPGCPAQTLTVPGADGKDQTVTVVRC